MSTTQAVLTILICGLATVLIRALPFLVFSGEKKTPPYILYLGQALAPAVYSMLVVYCLKSVSLTESPHGLPEAAGIAVTVLLHLWKKQTLLSIAGGTICYIFLIRFIF